MTLGPEDGRRDDGDGGTTGAGWSAPATVPAVCAGMVIAGFVAMALAWRGAAGTAALALQVPQAVSGGLGGLGLIVFGMATAYVHLSRVGAAAEAAAIDDINAALARAGVGIVVTPPPARDGRDRGERSARAVPRSATGRPSTTTRRRRRGRPAPS